MPRRESVLTVFVASPSDVADERARFEEIIQELNVSWSRELGIRLDLVRWETHSYPGAGRDAQEVINQQIPDEYDIFIGLMWHRCGTPTERAASGTIEEYERAKKRFDEDQNSVRIMFYFKDEPFPRKADLRQAEQVLDFQKRLSREGILFWEFTNENFDKLVKLHLTRQLQDWRKQNIEVNSKENCYSVENRDEASISCDVLLDSSEDDEGIMDLIDEFDDRMSDLQEITERITAHIEELGARVRASTDSLNDVSKRIPDRTNRHEAKRIISNTAQDMDNFSERIGVEIPLFNQNMKRGMNAYIKSVQLSEDLVFDMETEASLNESKAAVHVLGGVIGTSLNQIQSFRDSISTLPRMTSDLNRSKRRAVSVIDKLIQELKSGKTLVEEAEQAIVGRLASGSG